jgi:4-amino-4-deoxy-L-arabinose transferase-like glycosyltransferase
VLGRRTLAVAALVLVAAVVFVRPVGRRPLYNQDEVRYAILARDVAEHGRWFLPRVRDEVYLNKPPLFFWTVALISLPSGRVSDVSAPLVSVAAALAGVLGVFAIGRRLWGFATGFAAAAVLATMPFYFFMAHQVLTDMMLTAWLVWALYFYLRMVPPAPARFAWLGFYLCVAGALSTKGPAALLALLAAVITSAVIDGRAGLRALRLPWGMGLVALSTLPWLVPYLMQTEKSYTQSVLVTDYLAWYFRLHGDSRLAAFGAYLAGFLPWALVLPLMAHWWWVARPDRDRRRLLTWSAVYAAAVAISAAQRSRYFLPVLPLLALLFGEFFVRAPKAGGRALRRLPVLAAIFLVVALVAALAVMWAPPHMSDKGGDWLYLPAGGVERGLMAGLLLAGALAGVWVAWRSAGGFAMATCWAAAVIAVLALEGVGYPERYAEWYGVRSFAERVRKERPVAHLVVAYPDANLAFDFYLRRPIRELRRPDQLRAMVARSADRRALLLREERWTSVRAEADPSWRLVASATVGGRPFVLLRNFE